MRVLALVCLSCILCESPTSIRHKTSFPDLDCDYHSTTDYDHFAKLLFTIL